MKVTVTIEVDGETIKDSRDLALALVAAAANIDHGATLNYGYAEYGRVMLHGQKVGTVYYDPAVTVRNPSLTLSQQCTVHGVWASDGVCPVCEADKETLAAGLELIGEMPIIHPRIPPTRVITAGELKPDFTIIEAGRPFKVGNVRHTEDGYTYYSVRSLTGEPYQNDNACTLSIAGITVEAR